MIGFGLMGNQKRILPASEAAWVALMAGQLG